MCIRDSDNPVAIACDEAYDITYIGFEEDDGSIARYDYVNLRFLAEIDEDDNVILPGLLPESQSSTRVPLTTSMRLSPMSPPTQSRFGFRSWTMAVTPLLSMRFEVVESHGESHSSVVRS